MSTLLVVLVALVAVVVLLLLALLLRRPVGEAQARALEHQVLELRGQLAAVASASQHVPQQLSQGLAALTQAVSRQLADAQSGVNERLDETGRIVRDVREGLGRVAEMTRRLELVGQNVTELQQLLQVPKLRGTLGEVWLEELLRQVFPASHYAVQHAFASGERVDAVIRIGQRLVPIDAKFPLEACQRMLAAEGEQLDRERRAFRRALKARIDEIADRYIRPAEGTFEFALMYIPAEQVYYEAIVRGEQLEDGQSILAYAMARRVVPVSPHTFYAYLSAVLHGLKGLQVEERARELQAELGGLAQAFQRFRRAFALVGAHLGNAQRQHAEGERLAERLEQQLERLAGAPVEAGAASLDGATAVGTQQLTVGS